jgi:hypothetical protein
MRFYLSDRRMRLQLESTGEAREMYAVTVDHGCNGIVYVSCIMTNG